MRLRESVTLLQACFMLTIHKGIHFVLSFDYSLLRVSEVAVRGFVVNDESSLGEEEAVGVCLVGRVYHFLLQLGAQLRQLVDVLPLVGALGHAEGEVEFELRQDLPAEEVLFDQRQVR